MARRRRRFWLKLFGIAMTIPVAISLIIPLTGSQLSVSGVFWTAVTELMIGIPAGILGVIEAVELSRSSKVANPEKFAG